MRGLLALAVVLAGCATGTASSDDEVPIDASDDDPPDASDVDPPDAADVTPPDAAPVVEMTTVEMLCNDGGDNDSNGQTDCADARCVWACAALMTACTGANRLRVYTMAPLPQAIPDVSSVNASVAVTQTGTIVVAAVRFNATHTFDGDLDLSMTSPAASTINLTRDFGGTGDNYLSTVFLDSAPTAIAAGSAPFTGNFQPEQPLSVLVGQSLTGSWTSLLVDDAAQDTGSWTDLSISLCVTP